MWLSGLDTFLFSPSIAAVFNASSLIGCTVQDLMLVLSTHKIQAGKDEVAKRLTLQQVYETLELLSLVDICWQTH